MGGVIAQSSRMAFGFMALNGIGTWTGLKAKKVVKAKKERPWTVFSSIVGVFAQVRLQQRRPSGTLFCGWELW